MTQVAQSVSYQSGTRQLDGYLACPEGDGPFPAVVVIHEAFGLNENIKDIARRFAGEGYAALGLTHVIQISIVGRSTISYLDRAPAFFDQRRSQVALSR